MSKPLISVVMPVYNSFDFARSGGQQLLPKALESLLAQTYAHFELIILDNQSTDNTADICQHYASQDNRIRYIVDTEKRWAEGGIQQAATFMQGEFSMIANDDDLWEPMFMESMLKNYDIYPEVSLIYPNGNLLSIEGQNITSFIQAESQTYTQAMSPLSSYCRYIQKRNVIPIAFGLYRREAFEKTLPYEPFDALKYNMDHLFMVKYFLGGYKAQFIDECLFSYRSKQRPFDLSRYPDVPTIQERYRIWLYFVNHQLLFLGKLFELIERYHFTDLQRLYLQSVTLDPLIQQCYNLLKWVENDLAPDTTDIVQLASTAEQFQRNLLPLLSSEKKWGVFRTDNPDAARFHPLIVRDMLTHSLQIIETFAALLFQFGLDKSDMPLETGMFAQIEQAKQRFEKYLQHVTSDINHLNESSSQRILQEPADQDSYQSRISVISCQITSNNCWEETLNAVQSQTSKAYEHICVCGPGEDVQKIFQGYPRLTLVTEPFNGYIDALRKGLKFAKGEYLIFCPVSDTYPDPSWFERGIQILDSAPDISLVWGLTQNQLEECSTMAISCEQFHHQMAPQKEAFFTYWLDTGFCFPVAHFCVRKSVFEACLLACPAKMDVTEALLELNYQFHTQGYLTCFVPVVAGVNRTLPAIGLSQRYIKKVVEYRQDIIAGNVHPVFRDGSGQSLDTHYTYSPSPFLDETESLMLKGPALPSINMFPKYTFGKRFKVLMQRYFWNRFKYQVPN